LQDPEFVLVRRVPVIAPYTRLTTYEPANPTEPYEGLDTPNDAARYIELAGRSEALALRHSYRETGMTPEAFL
jgi:hypothetical protein